MITRTILGCARLKRNSPAQVDLSCSTTRRPHMAARRRGGKADESEGEEIYETPHGEAEEEEDQDSPHSSESGEYSDEGEEDEDEHEQDVGGEDSIQQAGSQTKEPSKQETLPATTLAQDGQPDNEGELGDGDEEGDGQEAGAGEESIPPPQVEEKEKDPSYVPTIGRFFMHDDRTGSRRGGYVPPYKHLIPSSSFSPHTKSLIIFLVIGRTQQSYGRRTQECGCTISLKPFRSMMYVPLCIFGTYFYSIDYTIILSCIHVLFISSFSSYNADQ